MSAFVTGKDGSFCAAKAVFMTVTLAMVVYMFIPISVGLREYTMSEMGVFLGVLAAIYGYRAKTKAVHSDNV